MKRIAGLLLLCSGFAILGCGQGDDAPKMAAVQGTVTWKGKPLADASIAFTPTSGPIAVGQTDGEGRYSLSTQGRSGAMVGSHRVAITAFAPPPAEASGSIDSGRSYTPVSRIPAKFGEVMNSGLDATVAPESAKNKIDFDLK